MGSATYSSNSRADRTVMYSSMSTNAIFTQKTINNAMSPYNIGIRESRDSASHPNSIAIIIALDVTGSMGSVPTFMVKEGLPKIIESLIAKGIADPQILFMGIGDHECDSSPLQVGQFESGDVELDHWLTNVYLEGGGGGNEGESYLLAWYFGAMHTSIDCHEKRGKKGYLITIGDEPTLSSIPKNVFDKFMGDGQHSTMSATQLLELAQAKYNVIHINVCSTSSGSRSKVKDGWTQLLSDNAIMAQRPDDIADIIVKTILDNEKVSSVQPTPIDPTYDVFKLEETL